MVAVRNSGNILIVGDDPLVAQPISEHLGRNNLSTRIIEAGEIAVDASPRPIADLVILANTDPVLNREVFESLRIRGESPVIVVGRDEGESDKLSWLENGADEYLTTPISMRELTARILVLLRRRDLKPVENRRPIPAGKLLFAGWELRLKIRQLRDPSGVIVPLTKGEFALLVAFAEASERPLSREYLQRATRLHGDIVDRSIDVIVLRLRRKLRGNGRGQDIIKTIRGIGYEFAVSTVRA